MKTNSTNGKGSKQRPTNKARFNANYDQINWEKCKRPTLKGRLANPIVTEIQAAQQLKESGVSYSEYAKGLLEHESFIGRPVSDFEDYPYVILSEDGVNFEFDKNAPWNCLGFHVKNGIVESVKYK